MNLINVCIAIFPICDNIFQKEFYLIAFTLANEPYALAFMQDTKYVPAAFKKIEFYGAQICLVLARSERMEGKGTDAFLY